MVCTQFLVSEWGDQTDHEVKVGTDKFSLQPKLIVLSLALLNEIFNQIFFYSTL